MKKLTAALLAVIMVVAMCMTAVAAEQGSNTNTGDGSITISNAKSGKTYDIYRMFDLTAVDTDADDIFNSYSYTVNANWEDFFIGTDAPGAAYLVEKTDSNASEYAGKNELTYGDKTYFMNITDDNVAVLAQTALPYAVGLANNDGSETAAADGDLTFDDIALGYYLVYPQGAADIAENFSSLCSLTTTQPNATISQKATYPDIEKVDDKEDVEVGEIVTYTVTGKVPDTTGYETYTYELNDKMTEGLTFNADVANMKVMFGTTEITVPEDGKVTLTYADNGFVMSFDMTEYQSYKGQTITITYEAVANDDAVVNITENEITLKYSDNPNDTTHFTTTPPQSEQVCSSRIVIDKFDKEDEDKKLAEAKFVLVDKSGEAEKYYKYNHELASVTWYTLAENETLAQAIAADKITEVITDEDGAAEFNGLKDGTYYLRETAAPDGYNMLDSDVMCEVKHTEDETTGKIIGVSLVKKIENSTGTVLPSTGGIGTTIFYIVGSMLVLGAVVLFVTKRRMAVKG